MSNKPRKTCENCGNGPIESDACMSKPCPDEMNPANWIPKTNTPDKLDELRTYAMKLGNTPGCWDGCNKKISEQILEILGEK